MSNVSLSIDAKCYFSIYQGASCLMPKIVCLPIPIIGDVTYGGIDKEKSISVRKN